MVFVGGGHNSLVAAAYAAKDGHDVTVLEARNVVGGAASTDSTTFKGYKLSSFSYLNSLFLPEVVRDLDLVRYGYEVIPRNPSSFTPLPDGRYLFLGPDMEANKREIAKFSAKDAEAYPRYEHELGELGDWMSKLMTMIPPNIPPRSLSDISSLLGVARHTLKLSFRQMARLRKLLISDPVDYLSDWFESDVVKATLLTDALIGAVELNGYVLLHHVMGEAGGARGVWGYMRGGMGGISESLRAACEVLGVEMITRARVSWIHTNDNRAVTGVSARIFESDWKQGTLKVFPADIVVSGVDPAHTFGKLMRSAKGAHEMGTRMRLRDTKSATMKINCTLKGLPNWKVVPGTTPGPQHFGTIHIAPTVRYILDALEAFHGGRVHKFPILEITLPSALDNTLAPPGRHVMNIFLQFYLYEGNPEVDERQKHAYINDVVWPLMREYVTNWDAIRDGVQILTPRDIEAELGMPGGNIFHGAMGLSQLFSFRPVSGMADYRVREFPGLYLCGAGTHPGGGVTGASGYNVARVIRADLQALAAPAEPYFFPAG